MSDARKIPQQLERFRRAVFRHDEINAGKCVAWGIGLCLFDMERLGFDEGEVLWSDPAPITVHQDQGGSGNFRVLCNSAEHGAEAESVSAVAGETVHA